MMAFLRFLFVILFTLTPTCLARKSSTKLNVIDQCWRLNLNWRTNRHQLATCSVGFTGKMMNNIGRDIISYQVTDPSDHPLNPRPGTLRYGATRITGKVWITFQRDMKIKLVQPLLVSSFTTIDGRGASVHIAGASFFLYVSDGSCLLLYKVTNVIIHSIRIHHCRPRPAGPVIGPDSKIMQMSPTDGDAIRLVGSSKVWIDHNTLYECTDGLLDVTRGSTDVTVSNNWFRNHDKVMLLGHDDGFVRDKNMRVTVVFNHFGPHCGERGSWNFQSVGDFFTNGASFRQTKGDWIKPSYNREQTFKVEDAKLVRSLTKSSGALRCPKTSRC